MRRLALVVVVALTPLLMLYGFWVQDAAVQATSRADFLSDADVRAQRWELWRSPPRGAGDRPFRWGLSEPMEPSFGMQSDLDRWRGIYDALSPDIIRIFLWWHSYQPNPNGELNLSSRSEKMLRFATDAGFGVYAVPFEGPKWAATGGWTRDVGDFRVWAHNPPQDFSDPDGPFGQFLAKVHSRYPQIDVWQIWNEPDFPKGQLGSESNPLFQRSWRGSAHDYGELLRSGKEKIRTIAPDAIVATGSVSHAGYVSAMLEVPGTTDVDLFDLHLAAGYGRPDPDWTLDKMLALAQRQRQAAVAAGVRDPHLSISELSFPYSSAGPSDQAEFLAKAYAVGAALGWDMLVWWGVGPFRPDVSSDTGLLNFDDSPRPAYYAWQFSKAQLRGLHARGLRGDGRHVRAAVVATASDRELWVAWSPSGQGAIDWPADNGPAVAYDAVGVRLGSVAPGETLHLSRGATYIVPA